MGSIKRVATSERGAALAEFAVSVPVLVLLVFGVVETARMFAAQQAVSQAAAAGARVAATHGDTLEVRNWIELELALALPGGQLTASEIRIEAHGGWCWGETVRVTVKAPYTVFMPGVGDISYELAATTEGGIERDLGVCPSY